MADNNTNTNSANNSEKSIDFDKMFDDDFSWGEDDTDNYIAACCK